MSRAQAKSSALERLEEDIAFLSPLHKIRLAERILGSLAENVASSAESDDNGALKEDAGLLAAAHVLVEQVEARLAQRPAESPRIPSIGALKELGIRISKEDIDEVRREMWKNFPREFPGEDR